MIVGKTQKHFYKPEIVTNTYYTRLTEPLDIIKHRVITQWPLSSIEIIIQISYRNGNCFIVTPLEHHPRKCIRYKIIKIIHAMYAGKSSTRTCYELIFF